MTEVKLFGKWAFDDVEVRRRLPNTYISSTLHGAGSVRAVAACRGAQPSSSRTALWLCQLPHTGRKPGTCTVACI